MSRRLMGIAAAAGVLTGGVLLMRPGAEPPCLACDVDRDGDCDLRDVAAEINGLHGPNMDGVVCCETDRLMLLIAAADCLGDCRIRAGSTATVAAKTWLMLAARTLPTMTGPEDNHGE